MKSKVTLLASIVIGCLFSFTSIFQSFLISRAEDSTTFLEESYKTMAFSKSACYSSSNVVNGSGSSHGLVPASSWADPITTGYGNVIYKLDASNGKAFDTLSLDINCLARNDLYMKDSSKITEAGFNIYFGSNTESFGQSIYRIDPWGGSGTFKDYSISLSTYVSGLSTAFVKVELCHDSGQVTLSSCATKLGSVKFSGTEKESEIQYVTKTDVYTKSVASGCSFDEVSNLGGFNNSNGLVPTKKWGGEITTASPAYVLYSLKTPVGPTFESIYVTFNGRAWSNGSGKNASGISTTTAGCNFKLYISGDKSNFGEPVETFESTTVSSETKYTYTDYTKCSNCSKVYIKIEMNHPDMTLSLSQAGTRLYGAEISGGYNKTKILPSSPINDSFILADDYKSYQQEGSFTDTTIGSGQYVYCGGDKASIIIPISCDSLYKFYNITFTQLVRCTVYGSSAPFENALTYSISTDNQNFTKLISLDTDSSWARTNVVIDLSEAIRNSHKAFVKIDFDWHGKAYSHDWIAIGNYTLVGDCIERNQFDVIYKNLEGATNHKDNPSIYNVGDVIEIKAPTKPHYSFKGWFEDEDFKTPFDGIKATTIGDLNLYAKWKPDDISITLNAMSGEFEGGAKTTTVQGSYECSLSRNGIPTPTSDKGTFINWFKEEECTNVFIFTEDYGEKDIITKEITLYAKYSITADVTYKYEDGVTPDVVFHQEAGEKAKTVPNPSLEGYKFGGWYNGDELFNFETILTESITLKARWYCIYQITYENVDEATHSNPNTFTKDMPDIVLQNATRPGYTFKCWELEGQPVTSIDTSIENDLVLEAKWEIINYSFSAVLDDHVSLLQTPSTITYEGITLQLRVDVGYRISMATANNKGLSINADNTIFIGGFAENVELVIDTVESNYYENSFDITFKDEIDLTEHIYDMNNVKKYTADSQSSHYGYLTVDSYNKPGYIIYAIDVGEGKTMNSLALTGKARIFSYKASPAVLDLYFSSDGIDYTLVNSFPSTTNGEQMTNIDVNLTSLAKGNRFAYIKYYIEGGGYDWVCLDGVHATMSFTCSKVKFMDGNEIIYTNDNQITGDKITLLENPTKEGYTFAGWYLESTFRNKIDENYIVEEDIEVYAKWIANTYNINYIVGEGADIGDNVETYTPEDEVIFSEAYKKNYKFVGWYDNPDFSGDPIEYFPKGTTGDKTLYAKFIEGTKIHYVLDGGENSELNPEVYFSDESTELFDPYKEGYVFAGWFTDPECKTMITAIEEGTTGEITLYALWIEDKDEPEERKGCGGSVIASTSLVAILSMLGITFVTSKRKDK